MEANIDDPCEALLLSSQNSSITKDERGVEAVDDLLEECWFFGNLLLNPKPAIRTFTRCYSDPCTSLPSPMLKDKDSLGGDSRRSLARAPSLPLNIGREDQGLVVHEGQRDDSKVMGHKVVHETQEVQACSVDKKEGDYQRKSMGSNKHKLLTRTQTLPTSMRNVQINQEEESDGKMSKSARRASLNLADILPPRHDKGTSRYRPPRNTEVEDTDGSKEMRRRYLNGRNLRRSTSELEIEEVQGFKDLGFTFDNKDLLSPSVVSILPGLQEKKSKDMDRESKVKRPYLSEAWLIQCSAPPTPNWASNGSSEDMKAQIKFWARSVASNVRLEC